MSEKAKPTRAWVAITPGGAVQLGWNYPSAIMDLDGISVYGNMTPGQAREIAERLIKAADNAESSTPKVADSGCGSESP